MEFLRRRLCGEIRPHLTTTLWYPSKLRYYGRHDLWTIVDLSQRPTEGRYLDYLRNVNWIVLRETLTLISLIVYMNVLYNPLVRSTTFYSLHRFTKTCLNLSAIPHGIFSSLSVNNESTLGTLSSAKSPIPWKDTGPPIRTQLSTSVEPDPTKYQYRYQKFRTTYK